MKAKDLRDRSTEDLEELRKIMRKDLFSYRMKNFTGQLDDSSLLSKTRRDIARVSLILSERARSGAASGRSIRPGERPHTDRGGQP